LTTALPKRVLVDANFLIAWQRKGADRETRARIEHLISRLDKAGARLVIPTPAIAEYLVGADLAGVEAINALSGKSTIQIASFDYKAAFDLSLIDRGALGAGDKRDGLDAPWQKIKVDRQIVAIARSNGCELIVSEDRGVYANALRIGIRTCKIEDLELPDSARQHPIPFKEPKPRKSPRTATSIKGDGAK